MVINVIAIGKMRDQNLLNLCNLYIKRLRKYVKVNIIEIKDMPLPIKHNASDIKTALEQEATLLFKHINERDYTVALAPHGKSVDSLTFSKNLSEYFVKGHATINFIIGSSYGLSEDVYKRANETISFSALTFPHEMFRLLLFEQLFRAFKISHNETYHK